MMRTVAETLFVESVLNRDRASVAVRDGSILATVLDGSTQGSTSDQFTG